MDRLEGIKEKIRAIAPSITEELLELLYGYTKERHAQDMAGSINSMMDGKEFSDMVQGMVTRQVPRR